MRLIYIASNKHTRAAGIASVCSCTKRVRSGEKLAWLGLQKVRSWPVYTARYPLSKAGHFFFCGNGPRGRGCEDSEKPEALLACEARRVGGCQEQRHVKNGRLTTGNAAIVYQKWTRAAISNSGQTAPDAGGYCEASSSL